MAVFKPETEAPGDNETQVNFVSQGKLGVSNLFNSEVAITDIVSVIDGMPWSVSYYHQIRNVNDQPLMPDVNIPSTELSYNRIDDLELKLQESLPNTGDVGLEATAYINAGIVPHYGDPFLGTLAGGKQAIFTVTEVTRTNYNTRDVYLLKFNLFEFLDNNVEVYNDLQFKTTKKYVYDKDHLQTNSTPIILDSEYKRKVDIKKEQPKIVNHMMNLFFNKKTRLLVPPTTSSVYIDTLLTEFFFSIVDIDQHPQINQIKRLSFQPDVLVTIWTAILHRDISALPAVDKDLGFKYVPASGISPVMRGMGYLGANCVVDQLDGSDPVEMTVEENRLSSLNTVEQPFDVNNKSYIFSDAFYIDDTNNSTTFEKLLLQYLRGEIIDKEVLYTMFEEYKSWGYLEQYYCLPILLAMIKVSISETFTEL